MALIPWRPRRPGRFWTRRLTVTIYDAVAPPLIQSVIVGAMVEIAEFTRSQIDALSLDPTRPLVISDADEVIVHLARPLEIFLTNRGYQIDLSDYRLFGNVRYPDGRVMEMEPLMALLDEFFEAEVEKLPPVAGAVDALCALRERAQ